jgi:Aspartate/ornithine carbamoyltransferase, carbamoyl-P binding domain
MAERHVSPFFTLPGHLSGLVPPVNLTEGANAASASERFPLLRRGIVPLGQEILGYSPPIEKEIVPAMADRWDDPAAANLDDLDLMDIPSGKARQPAPTADTSCLAGRRGGAYSPGLMQEYAFRHRHLLGIEGMTPEDINFVLDLADGYVELNRQAEKKNARLCGRTLINCFFENSTRTRTSFEVAGKRLGADVINMAVQASSMRKGETLIDTAIQRRADRSGNVVSPFSIVGRYPASRA